MHGVEGAHASKTINQNGKWEYEGDLVQRLSTHQK